MEHIKLNILNSDKSLKATYFVAIKLVLLCFLMGGITIQYLIQESQSMHETCDFSDKESKKENVEKEEKSDVDEYYHFDFNNPLHYSYNITAMLDHLKGWQNFCMDTVTPPPEYC